MKKAGIAAAAAREVRDRLSYYLHRIITPLYLRRAIVAALQRYVRYRQHDLLLASTEICRVAVSELENVGYAPLGQLLSQVHCLEIHRYLDDKLLTDRDTQRAPFLISAPPPGARLADFSFTDVIACPHVLALANCPLLLNLASSYIGCKPTLSSAVIRWSCADPNGASDLQRFHRDADDWRFFKVMVYLTDVQDGFGPHIYVRATHRGGRALRQRFWTDEEILRLYGQDHVAIAFGDMGSAFAVDTFGIHKGQAPTRGVRLMLMLQYSLLPCYHARRPPLDIPRPAELDQYVNRLIFAAH